MRVYRVIRAVNRGYPLAVLWLYVAAFLLAVVLMFMHPLGTIVLVWIGLLGLVFALLVAKLLAVVQRIVARNILAAGACPGCGGHLSGADAEAKVRRCEACGSMFLVTGAEEAPPAPAAGAGNG